ncbi:hypothetical protein [Halobacillus sp. A5]|uniref:hypothetical protein n=1 Tax=Halobacillus sp. A5 TaxID=2880263 RepID=UPI0020A67A0F|nr:hypothetical protein [Halobacillus sp. A5]MCP3027025.1 hypothetical protein [Halobacillus sp. A5]
MALRCIVYIEGVSEKTPYTIIIRGRSATYGSSPEFELEYTGADLIQKKGYIPNNVMELLKEDLNELVGYGPYQKKRVKKLKETSSFLYYLDGENASRN